MSVLSKNRNVMTGIFIEQKLIFKFRKPKRIMGLKEHQEGFKLSNYLEWWSSVAAVRKRLLSTLVVQLKRRLESP